MNGPLIDPLVLGQRTIEIVGSGDKRKYYRFRPAPFYGGIASLQTSKQPYVVNYVADALMEEDEGEDALVLTEDQKGFLFMILKSVIDVLDEKGIA